MISTRHATLARNGLAFQVSFALLRRSTLNQDRAAMLVDHHCHLDFKDFAPERDAVVARAVAAGVGVLVTISTRVRHFESYRDIAETYPNVFFSIGTHPHAAHEELDVTVADLVRLSGHPKCVAIGEAGLDYFYKDKSPRDAQRQGLLNHIAAARETGLPLVIHSRDADDDMGDILDAEMAKGAFKAVLHCFTGGERLANRAVALGLYISFSGVITFKNSEALRAIARDTAADRILVETDSPYLAPMPHRGKRNEPAFVAHTAAVLAQVRGLSVEDTARLTTDNFYRLYDKTPRLVISA
jgi:TatD DNase family protein